MDALVAILACSLYRDDPLVRAIVDNAQGNPYAILTPQLDPDTGSLSSAPKTLDAAVAELRDLIAQGAAPLLGLMQVPVAWASTFGRAPRDLFDPCINVSIGSAMLSEFSYACAAPKIAATGQKRSASSALAAQRGCVLRRYAEAVRSPELTTVVTLTLRYQHTAPSVPLDAPIFPPAQQQRTWGSDWLFLPARSPDEHAAGGASP
jgi:hypothetical protein